MKNLCRRYAGLCFMALLVCLTSCGKLDKVDGLEALPNAISSSRADKCALTVGGRIVNTKNLEPIVGVEISGETFSAITDENGEFSVELELLEDDIIDDIIVSKEGFLNKEFKAYLSSVAPLATCPIVTNINWDIAISERKQEVFVGPRDGAWYKIMDTVATRIGELDSTILLTRIFTIDIRRGALENPSRVVISPDNSRAAGSGIPPDNRSLLIEKFAIEVNGNNFAGGASSRNTIEFAKALDIRWLPPMAFDPATSTSIDLGDLGISEEEIFLDGNGNVVFLVSEDGDQAIGELLTVTEVVVPLVEAIEMEEPLEEIEEEFVENLEVVSVASGEGVTAITSDVESNGRIANQASFSNCECGDLTAVNYTAQLTGTESINIDFSAGATDAEQAEAQERLRTIVGANGGGDESVDITVTLDKCQTTTVTSQEIIRTVTGTVLGFPFTFEGTDRLETTEAPGDCPTDTPCHQGCPG